MLINFWARNFRSIREQVQLSFEASGSRDLEDYYIVDPGRGLRLLKLGLIYGPNASGKTTILLALDFLRNLVLDPLDTKSEPLSLEPFRFTSQPGSSTTSLALEFFHEGVRYYFQTELCRTHIVAEELYFHQPNKALVFKRQTDPEKKLTSIEFGSKVQISKAHKEALEANTLWNNSVLGGFLKTNVDSPILQQVVNWFRNVLKPMVSPKTGLYGFISDRIEFGDIDKRIVIDQLGKAGLSITDLLIDRGDYDKGYSSEFVLRELLHITKNEVGNIGYASKLEPRRLQFEHAVGPERFWLDYRDESNGTQRLFQLSGLLAMMIQEGIIVPIDELEASLHPDLMKHFLLTFLSSAPTSQLIATTHHRELLMERDMLREDAIWLTEKNDHGATTLYSVDEFDSSVVRNTSSLFNAYKSGKLGARPALGDFYVQQP